MSDVLPCPFCGHIGVAVEQGSTFRWRVAICQECGAQSGEVRVQTIGDGNAEKWEANAIADAIKEWNTRAERESKDGGVE